MNFLGLLSFGLFFSYAVLKNIKPKLCIPNTIEYHNLVSSSKKTLVFFVIIFLIISAFQYINTAGYTRWAEGGNWSNDMSRYKFIFEDAGGYSLPLFFKTHSQEPLFLLFLYGMRKITTHFSIVLLISYGFIIIAVIQFLKYYLRKVDFITIFSFYSILFTFIIITYCLFRMGLAFALILYAYRYILLGKIKKALLLIIFACCFHFSASFLFFICIMYEIFIKHRKHFSTFLFIFFCTFLAGLLLAHYIPNIVLSIDDRYRSYVRYGGNIAVNTFVTNFIILLLLLNKRNKFFKTKIDDVCFVCLLSTFLILDLQLFMGIFYRMIYFSYPCIMLIICRLYQIYKPKRKTMSFAVLVRTFCVCYLSYYLYKFYATGWCTYGLDSYKLFYFY